MSRFLDIAQNYDAFLLDLWGVIHDGTALYPGVRETLVQLKAQDKQVIFVSNAPRRAHRVMAVLAELGIEKSLYGTAVSSGEMGFMFLASGHSGMGKRYFYIGPDKDLGVLDGTDFQRIESLAEANFLLNVGFGSDEQSDENFLPLLREAKALKLPMLCFNPDMEVVKITGERFPCAGVIAKQYETLGGQVAWFGKPYNEIYGYCLGWLDIDETPKNKILAVGDSLETDIRGGANAGLDTMLITGGIFKHKSAQEIEELCAQSKLKPTYILPQFG